jgi:hypothetical protein
MDEPSGLRVCARGSIVGTALMRISVIWEAVMLSGLTLCVFMQRDGEWSELVYFGPPVLCASLAFQHWLTLCYLSLAKSALARCSRDLVRRASSDIHNAPLRCGSPTFTRPRAGNLHVSLITLVLRDGQSLPSDSAGANQHVFSEHRRSPPTYLRCLLCSCCPFQWDASWQHTAGHHPAPSPSCRIASSV